MTLASLLGRPEAERRLGPFILIKPLGHGGFAPVWLAKEVHGPIELRVAAVKLFALDMDPGGADSKSIAEARRREILEEARALCRVEHPSVVRFYAPALDDVSGVMGLAMEYVAGASLDQRLAERGRISVTEALDVGLAMASALAAVHRAGLVHGDVKPANMIESTAGVYKLIDFGIASADVPDATSQAARSEGAQAPGDEPLAHGEAHASGLDRLGDAVGMGGARTVSVDVPALLRAPSGTSGYIDPICISMGTPATPASDIYALGATLFECITGLRPAAALSTAPGGLRGEVLDGRAPAPALLDVARDVPPPLGSLVDAMLARERHHRPASAEAVVKELARLRSELAPVSMGSAPAGIDERRRASRNEVLWVDDDRFALTSMGFWLTDRGYEVIPARTPAEAIRFLRSNCSGIGCAILDLFLPGPSSSIEPSGLRLARQIKREWPGIPLLCLSNVVLAPAVEWFSTFGAGYFHKHELNTSMRPFMRTIEELMMGRKPPPGTLVVHGRADRLLAELRGYLSDELRWTDIRVLSEIPSARRSLVQKFSDEAREAELIFVLLSPEDVTFASADQQKSREGKADLVFELGYILGSSKRRSCKIVVLTTVGASLPVPVDDIAVIDVAAGLRSAARLLRLELLEWIE